MEVLLAKMTSSKDAATRYECMKALNTGLKEFERTAALSLNMVAGSWHAENTERGFERLRSQRNLCLLYTSPSPRDIEESRMPSSA